MVKFLQIALVAVVALLSIAFVVERIIASRMSRAREISSAALKEKLVQRAGDEDWGGGHPIPAPTTPPDSTPNPVSLGKDALRAKWIAFVEEMEPKWREECGNLSQELQSVLTATLMGDEELEATDTQRAELAKYRASLGPIRDRALDLVDLTGDMHNLVGPEEFDQASQMVNRARHFGFWALHTSVNLDMFLSDYTNALDAYIAAAQMLLGDDVLFYPTIRWNALKIAMESEQVDTAQWDRLLEALAMRRRSDYFADKKRFEATRMIHAFENWKSLYRDPHFFKKAPVSYLRTWAYPRLAPALFNHDFDQFNRATTRLLDMVDRPYFAIIPELEVFCDEFDLEPSVDDIKFTRGNPGWHFVLDLARHGFENNARNQASIDVMQFAILLDRHYRAQGNYPDSLAVFEEHFGGTLPVNPLRGDAYVYESTGDTFKLGFTRDENPEMVELGMDPIRMTYWHDPKGFENVPE